jgi:hypothetical protein
VLASLLQNAQEFLRGGSKVLQSAMFRMPRSIRVSTLGPIALPKALPVPMAMYPHFGQFLALFAKRLSYSIPQVLNHGR